MVPENGSAEERAVLKALTGDGESVGDGTPGWTPPQSQTSQASGQPAKKPGHLSQHMNLVKQMRGLISTGQQGQGVAAPAARPGDVEGAGPALGTEGAEGASIDVAAVGPEGSREPSPAERAR